MAIGTSKIGVLGGKIIGAGGGGFLLLYAPKQRKTLSNFMETYGCKRLNFNVDNKGSSVIGNF